MQLLALHSRLAREDREHGGTGLFERVFLRGFPWVRAVRIASSTHFDAKLSGERFQYFDFRKRNALKVDTRQMFDCSFGGKR
jgi:hypothetical protein